MTGDNIDKHFKVLSGKLTCQKLDNPLNDARQETFSLIISR